MRHLSILLVGDTDRNEFADAWADLHCWGEVCAFDRVAAATAALAEGQFVPDVIVLAQAFPGQFSHAAIEDLRRLAPLARVVGLMGSWCEGEMRTGLPWPGVVRTYWHQWTARCCREVGRLARGERCPWMLPPTATEEERLLVDAAERWPRRDGLVLVRAFSYETAQWLSAACRSLGLATVWQRSLTGACVEGALAAIFDAADVGEETCNGLDRLAQTLHPAPVIAMLAFPRAEDRRRVLAAGAAAVISKPLVVEDLFWELDRVCGTRVSP